MLNSTARSAKEVDQIVETICMPVICNERKPACVLVEITKLFLCAEISHLYPLIHYANPSEGLYNINRYTHTYVYIITSKTKGTVNNIIQY
jgi:hypothetical protein